MKRNVIILVALLFCSSVFVGGQDKNKSLQLFFIEIKTMGDNEVSKYFVYDVDNNEKMIIPKLQSYGPPIISEDGKYFAYQFEENDKRFMKLLDVEADEIVLNKPIHFSVIDKNFGKDYIALSGNTTRHFYTREIYLINIETGKLEQVTDNDVMDYDPVVSGNNDALLFLQMDKELTKTILKRYSISRKTIETIYTFGDTGYYLFQWLENDWVLLTKRERSGVPFLFNLKSTETREINLDRISDIAISPDGKKMMYIRMAGYDDPVGYLYISDIDGSNVLEIKANDKRVDFITPQWFIR